MIAVLRAAREVQEFLEEQAWSFAFIGGLAVDRWGRARATNDADLCLFTDFGEEAPFVDLLMERFVSRIDNAKEFALLNRVVLLVTESGSGIDVSLGAFDFERNSISRSSSFIFPEGVDLLTVSAEDLVVYKAFSGRPQVRFDIEGIIVRQGLLLDWQLILQVLTPLCELKEASDTVDRLTELRDQLAE